MTNLRGVFISIGNVEAVDGDTIKFRSQYRDKEYRVRIADLWCPEMRGQHAEAGWRAKHHLNAILLAADHVQLFLPRSEVDHDFSLIDLVTFGRLACHVVVDGEMVSDRMVEAGVGFRTKQDQIDAGVYGR